MTASVAITEPLGARQAVLPLELGGVGADIVVPGMTGAALRVEGVGDQWWLRVPVDATAVVNGCVPGESVALADGDVIGVGDAHVTVYPAAGRMRVAHLAGNTTVAPVVTGVMPGEVVVAGVREIIAAGGDAAASRVAAPGAAAGAARLHRIAVAAAVLVLAATLWLLFGLVPVAIVVKPGAAQITASGPIHWRAGERLFLLRGQRILTLSSPGYHTRRVTLQVTHALADSAPIRLELDLLPGVLAINTQGDAAELLVDGRRVGALPGQYSVEPGRHDILVRAPQRLDYSDRIDIHGGAQRQTLDVRLLPSFGWLLLDTAPPGARISINGEYQGSAPQKIQLDAGLHSLSVAAPGRRGWSTQVAIVAGQALDLGTVDLAAPPAAHAAAPATGSAAVLVADAAAPVPSTPVAPARLQSALLGALVLFPAGQYQQGSDRREQGRRSNEVSRAVTLSRPFYLAANETTMAQFRVFRPAHAAGIAMERSLDLDAQAVTNISWSDAVEFCNWLSQREGLPMAYERRDGRWQLVLPHNHGYRLPTEAEWEYAARYVDGMRWQRYAWGDVLPPPAGAANLAGQESLPTRPGPDVRLAMALPGYRDDHPVVAPAGSYAPSATGLFDMGGNVSEWVHDVYVSLPDVAAVVDPMGADADGPHGIRGPNWHTANMADLRLAWRDRSAGPAQTVGLRVARYLESAP